jgi:outer membrane protein TolC
VASKIFHQDAAADLTAQVLAEMALDDRNRSAGKALDAYYRLGKAEALKDILAASLTQVRDAQTKAKSAKDAGLDLSFDETRIDRQLIDLQINEAQLRLKIAELNSDLRRYMNLVDCPHDWAIWPGDALVVPPATVDCDEAVATGLAHRPDLRILDLLDAALADGNADGVKSQLATLNQALAQPRAVMCPCLVKLMALCAASAARDAEMNTLAEEVALLRAQRRREAVDEIRQAVWTIAAQTTVVSLAQERAGSWQQRAQRLKELETKGVGSFLEATEARVELLQAQRKVIEEITNLQRAWVKLRLSQGVLPRDCLTSPPPLPESAAPRNACPAKISGALPALAAPQTPPASGGATIDLPIATGSR